jgi:integrase
VFRAEFMGWNYGIPAEFLSFDPHALSYTLLHNILVRPGAGEMLDIVASIWAAFDRFGTRDAAWVPYWHSAELVTVDAPHVSVCAFVRTDRLLLVVGYHTGAREGELLSAQWTGVTDDQIRLEASTTKTKKARVLPVYGEMRHWLDMARAERDMHYPRCPWIFQVDGERMIFNWRTWRNLCLLAGVPGLLFHDLRRTALTNLIAAGISEKEAMEVSGHQTRKTFERYPIISDRNLRRVAARMEEYFLGTLGTPLGTPAPLEKAKLLN